MFKFRVPSLRAEISETVPPIIGVAIATDPLVLQGLNAYPRTIMAAAFPRTSLRIIEET